MNKGLYVKLTFFVWLIFFHPNKLAMDSWNILSLKTNAQFPGILLLRSKLMVWDSKADSTSKCSSSLEKNTMIFGFIVLFVLVILQLVRFNIWKKSWKITCINVLTHQISIGHFWLASAFRKYLKFSVLLWPQNVKHSRCRFYIPRTNYRISCLNFLNTYIRILGFSFLFVRLRRWN